MNPHLDILRIMLKFADEMAKQCTDMDDALRLINQRLRKLEKSDSEKTEEIGRLNRIINRKDKEIHSLKAELATTRKELSEAKARITELEGDDGEDGSSYGPGKPGGGVEYIQECPQDDDSKKPIACTAQSAPHLLEIELCDHYCQHHDAEQEEPILISFLHLNPCSSLAALLR